MRHARGSTTLLMTMVILARAFRVLPIALVWKGLKLASVGVAFVLITLVFQHG